MADTLAQTIKAKYPGKYDDLSDAELESRIDARYPGAYSDFPRATVRNEIVDPVVRAAKTRSDEGVKAANRAALEENLVQTDPRLSGAAHINDTAAGLAIGVPAAAGAAYLATPPILAAATNPAVQDVAIGLGKGAIKGLAEGGAAYWLLKHLGLIR